MFLEGIYKEYLPIEHSGMSPRGKILVLDTLRQNWARGRFATATYRDFPFTENTSFNRCLKLALWISFTQARSFGATELAQRAYDSYEWFSRVDLDDRASVSWPEVEGALKASQATHNTLLL